MTPTKDALETATSASETAASSNKAKQDVTRLRSDAVSLEVPVKVHGSRVTEVVLGTTPHTEPFEEQTTTMIVFPQGGVLKMTTPVAVGQMMVVTNLKSGHDSICRVVKVRAYGQGQSYVEIEFTHRQAGYWGVYFPSDGSELPQAAAPAAAPTPVSVELKVEKPEEKPQIVRPAPVQNAKPDSAFAPIGSQEDVQPAASSTSRVRPSSIVEAELKRSELDASRRAPVLDLPFASAPSAPSLSIGELQGDTRASSISFAGAGVPGEADVEEEIESSTAAQSAPSFEKLGTTSLSSSHAASREPFGSGLTIGGHSADAAPKKSSNLLAIAAAIAVLLVGGAAAAYYMHLPPFAAKPSQSAPVATAPVAPPVESAPQSATSEPAANQTPAQVAQTNVAPSPVASAPVVSSRVPDSSPAKTNKPVAVPVPLPAPTAAAPAASKPAAKVPDMFGALNAHPTSHTYSADQGQPQAAPVLDGVAGSEGALPAISGGPGPASPLQASQAAQVPATEGPVRVGGQIKPPRLITSILPVYPQVAKNAGVEGDVIIDTTVDAKGGVTGMKVVSGSPLLRQAALNALRQWKYEPTRLNGEPVPVQMTVTIRFHRQ